MLNNNYTNLLQLENLCQLYFRNHIYKFCLLIVNHAYSFYKYNIISNLDKIYVVA